MYQDSEQLRVNYDTYLEHKEEIENMLNIYRSKISLRGFDKDVFEELKSNQEPFLTSFIHRNDLHGQNFGDFFYFATFLRIFSGISDKYSWDRLKIATTAFGPSKSYKDCITNFGITKRKPYPNRSLKVSEPRGKGF